MAQHVGHLEIIGAGRLDTRDGIGENARCNRVIANRFASHEALPGVREAFLEGPPGAPHRSGRTHDPARGNVPPQDHRVISLAGSSVGERHANIVEKDVAVAVGLQPRLDLEVSESETLRVFRDIDQGDAVFAQLRIGLADHAVEGRDARVAGKPLGSVDDPFVTIFPGARLDGAAVHLRKILDVAPARRLGHGKAGKGRLLLLLHPVIQIDDLAVAAVEGPGHGPATDARHQPDTRVATCELLDHGTGVGKRRAASCCSFFGKIDIEHTQSRHLDQELIDEDVVDVSVDLVSNRHDLLVDEPANHIRDHLA